MRRNDRAAAAFTAAAVLAGSSAASAYCRTSSCPDIGTSQVCTPATADDCGTPLAWKRSCVGWSLQKDASTQISFAEMDPLVTAAFGAWMNVTCPGGGHPAITVQRAEPAECAAHEYNQEAGNANIIVFRDDAWPYVGTANILALTSVTYNLEDGEIYDADMELNSAGTDFTTGDTGVEYDLLSIVTHEAGHFLGLAHSLDESATMFPNYKPHTIDLREPSADDIAGVCAIYPPGMNGGACDMTPRHGYSALCAADQPPGSVDDPEADAGGCSAAGRAGSAGGWVLFSAWAGALALAARRLRARRSRRG